MASPSEHRVEVVMGELDPGLSERLVEFWVGQGALDETGAHERLSEVVCVLFDADGEIAGVNSAYAATAPLVGRRFWIYRRLLAPAVEDAADRAMLKAALDELAGRFTAAADEPIGLCVLISDRALMERHPEAVWTDADLLYAGYTEQGVQVRIAYFEGARI